MTNIWTRGPSLEQRTVRQGYVPNYNSSLEENVFEPKPLAAGPFYTAGPLSQQSWQMSTKQCFIPNIKDKIQSKLLTAADARRTKHNARWALTDQNISSFGVLKINLINVITAIKLL